MLALLLSKQEQLINRQTVQRMMAARSIRSLIRVEKYRSLTDEKGKLTTHILDRDVGASNVNKKWIMDVNALLVQQKKLYLSPVLDLFNREISS